MEYGLHGNIKRLQEGEAMLTESRVRDEGKARLTHAEVKKRYGVK
jgi:hypothetical protein